MTNPAKLPMTRRSLRNLFSRPATRLYPQTVRPRFEGARGQLELDVDACNFCGLCARRCPTEALCVTRDQRLVEIDDLRCLACGICVDVCAKKAMHLTTEAPQVYAACMVGGDACLGRRDWQGPPPAAKAAAPPVVATAARRPTEPAG
jgi:Pyruvate/2-oxoacid:ferredoxin oxidoreductase delta subunit